MDRYLPTKVLLVDDEEEFARLLARRLETRGMKVTAAACGEEAVALVEKQRFDVAVVDLSMPGIDGIETLKQIRGRRPNLKVLMLTGHATVAGGIEAMKQGADDFLQKPVAMDELLEKIKTARQSRLTALHRKADAEMQEILKRKAW